MKPVYIQQTFTSISSTMQDLPISQLHLSNELFAALTKAGISTVRQLLQSSYADLLNVEEVSVSSINTLKETVAALQNSFNSEGEVDWLKYTELQNIELLHHPSGDKTSFSVIDEMVETVKEIFKREFKDSERAWVIVQRRFALESEERLSLEELGHIFNLTRERVRQIEEKALTTLRCVLFEADYSGRKYRLSPEFNLALAELRTLILLQVNPFGLETVLLNAIEQKISFNINHSKQILLLIFSLLGITRLEFDNSELTPILGFIEPQMIRKIEKIIRFLAKLLTEETSHPKNEFDVLLALNKEMPKSQRVSPEELRVFITLCSMIEYRKNGSIWGKFEYLKGRGNQVERLLIEHGQPVELAELTRKINSCLVPLGRKRVEERNIRNQLCNDNRFAPIGKSGLWGLKMWENIETSSIVKVMEEFFLIHDKPATVDDIYAYVSERRPVSKKSIILYLSYKTLGKNKFAKIDRTQWGLSGWKEATGSVTWNPEQVAEFVAGFFRKKRAKELNYKLVKQALIEATDATDRQVQGLLNINPIIETYRDNTTGELVAVFQADYKEKLINGRARYQRKKVTLREKISATVKELLKAAPKKQLPLSILIERAMGEHGCPKHTAYQYVSKLEYIERFDDPSSKTKMCRLKEASRLEVVSENRDDVGDAIANQEDLAKTSYILHLSDLHFGTLENAKIWANQLAADISNDLNIPRLDTIILSGDIANYSTLDEYDAAVQFLNQLTQEFTLQPEQIILVPGNHDLNWQLSKTAYTLKDLSDCQPHELQEGRYISVSDDVVRVRDEERYKQRFAHFSHFYQTIKGHPYPLDYDQQGILHHLPQQSLLILGLNSAWQLDHHYKDRATIHPTALSNALTQIRSNRDQYKDCLKLAVWHHPLDSPWSDRIADQGFLEQLAVNGFRLILHGHIHKAETSLYRYDLSKDGRKLDRICAGTFGAPTRELIPAYPWQYNIIKVYRELHRHPCKIRLTIYSKAKYSTLILLYREFMSPSGPSVDHPIQPLNAFEIYSRYLTSLQEKQTIQDTKNAVIRYFVPSVGGPIPSAQKRRPITSEEVESAHQFLKTVPLEMFADATDWASKVLEKLDRSPSQRERVCHDLKSLVNWARECKHLAPSKNLIPQDICRHIQVGRYRGLSLKPANAQQIVEKFLLQINDESFAIEARNAIVRFLSQAVVVQFHAINPR